MCCDCIAYHLRSRELPACAFPADAERTYDRTFEHFVRLVEKGKRLGGYAALLRRQGSFRKPRSAGRTERREDADHAGGFHGRDALAQLQRRGRRCR